MDPTSINIDLFSLEMAEKLMQEADWSVIYSYVKDLFPKEEFINSLLQLADETETGNGMHENSKRLYLSLMQYYPARDDIKTIFIQKVLNTYL